MEAIVFIIPHLQIFFATRAVLKIKTNHASQNIWWIIISVNYERASFMLWRLNLTGLVNMDILLYYFLLVKDF